MKKNLWVCLVCCGWLLVGCGMEPLPQERERGAVEATKREAAHQGRSQANEPQANGFGLGQPYSALSGGRIGIEATPSFALPSTKQGALAREHQLPLQQPPAVLFPTPTKSSAFHQALLAFGKKAIPAGTVTGAAQDAQGNSYFCGHFSGIMTFGRQVLNAGRTIQAFVARFDKTRRLVWLKALSKGPIAKALAIAVSQKGTIAVVGEFSGSVTLGLQSVSTRLRTDGFIVSMHIDGRIAWAQSALLSTHGQLFKVFLDSQDNIWVAEHIERSSNPGASRNLTGNISKYTPKGKLLWRTNWQSAGGVIFDHLIMSNKDVLYAAGTVFRGGTFEKKTAGPGYGLFVAKLLSTGKTEWVAPFHYAENGVLAIGPSGLYVYGELEHGWMYDEKGTQTLRGRRFAGLLDTKGTRLWTQVR